MKKHKISIMLNIATLCLALVAVVFGVYSLRQASMSVNGSLGFVAHNVKANIVTSITGSVAEANATYSKTDVFKPSGDAGITLNGDTQNISFTRYFSDNGTVNNKPAPIKVSFAITNQSVFDIKVDVSTPTLPTGVTMTTDKSSIKIAQNASGNITATFYLDSASTGLETTPITGLTLELSKFEFKKSDIPVNYDARGKLSNYYIEYGTGKVGSTTYPINWYIIGKYVNNEITALGSDDLAPVTVNTTYKMKDTITYAFMSDYILTSGGGTTNETKFVPFNNNVFIEEMSSEGKSLEYPEVDANDYSISTIRAYLNGKTVYTKHSSTSATLNGTSGKNYTPDKTGTTANFFTQNTLKGNNKTNDIYTLIQPRTLENMYKKMYEATDLTPPTAVEGISGTDADAFWLLSQNEARTLWTIEEALAGKIPTPKTDNTSSYNAYADNWWLCSPDHISYNVVDVSVGGNIGSFQVYKFVCGVRAAFLI